MLYRCRAVLAEETEARICKHLTCSCSRVVGRYVGVFRLASVYYRVLDNLHGEVSQVPYLLSVACHSLVSSVWGHNDAYDSLAA